MPLVLTLIAAPGQNHLTELIAREAAALVEGKSPVWLSPGAACDIELPANTEPATAEALLRAFVNPLKIDIAIQEQGERRKKAIIADMDSTMIDQECIDELAAEVGLKEQVAGITARAMNGEIEFEPAVRERVALLEGLDASVIETIIERRITLASGGRTLIQTMKAKGAHSALVSGGFTSFTNRIAALLGFDENHANRLEEVDGKLSGRVIPPILGAAAKVESLLRIADERAIAVSDFVAVGDGANDLPMLLRAGTGVALHAKPSVAAKARIRIDHGDLTALLYLQGYHENEFVS